MLKLYKILDSPPKKKKKEDKLDEHDPELTPEAKSARQTVHKKSHELIDLTIKNDTTRDINFGQSSQNLTEDHR